MDDPKVILTFRSRTELILTFWEKNLFTGILKFLDSFHDGYQDAEKDEKYIKECGLYVRGRKFNVVYRVVLVPEAWSTEIRPVRGTELVVDDVMLGV